MSGLTKIKSISNRFKNIILATAFVLTQFVVPAGNMLVGSAAASPGNNGTIKVDGNDLGSGQDNDPHVGCSFNIAWWNYDKHNSIDAIVSFELQDPTTPPDNTMSVTGDTTPSFSSPGGTVLDHTETYTLAFTGVPQPQQGYHVKLTVNTPYSHGSDTKHKTFWVDGCSQKIEVPAQPEVNDPCGVDNATWQIPDDTATVTWSLNNGKELIATTAAGYVFTDGNTTHNYGTASDSGEPCPPATGSVQVLKQVDEGDGKWVDANGPASDFKWGLDQESATRDMGSTVTNVLAGSHSVVENSSSVDDYELIGWFVGDGSCSNEQNSTASAAEVTVGEDQTTVVTFCNRVKQDSKVELCHATDSESNPFVLISISPSGAYHGHYLQHEDDIIPTFTYKGDSYSLNWDDAGQAIFRNGCDTLGSISGYKWNDKNGNTQWGFGEHGISGWTIKLYKWQNFHYQHVDNATTNSWGKYSFDNLPYGKYKVCEGWRPGWKQTYPGSDSLWCHYLTVSKDQKSFTGENFGNQGRGTITVVKNVDDGFGNVDYFAKGWTWNYWGKYQSGNHENASLFNTKNVPAGKYLISENNKKGYHFESLKCVALGGFDFERMSEQSFNQLIANGDGVYYFNDKALVDVDPGTHVFCAFMNVHNTGSLTVVKDATPNDPQWFDFTVEGKNMCEYHKPSVFDGVEGLLNVNNENNNDNENENCDKTKQVDEFSLQDYQDPANATHTKALKSGWYKVTEGTVSGWVLSGITCGDAPTKVLDNSVWVYVGNDKDVTCTFSNTKLAKVTVVKDAQPDSLQAFTFSSDLSGETANFDLVDDGALPGIGSKSFAELMPGVYHISEAAVSGWTLKDISCGDASMTQDGSGITLTVNAGDDITCTFVNAKKPAGHVLGESTTNVLPNTGSSALVSIVAGFLLIVTAAAARFLGGRRSQNSTL